MKNDQIRRIQSKTKTNPLKMQKHCPHVTYESTTNASEQVNE